MPFSSNFFSCNVWFLSITSCNVWFYDVVTDIRCFTFQSQLCTASLIVKFISCNDSPLILSFPCLRTQLLFFFSALRDLKDISSHRQDGRATWFQNRNCNEIDCKQENSMYKKLKGKALENYDTFLLTFISKKSFDKCSFIATTFCLKS